MFLRESGIELFVRINQPFPTKDTGKRKDRWERSKRLQKEALVCLTSVGNTHIFCVASAQGRPTQAHLGDRVPSEHPAQNEKLQKYSLWNPYTREDGAYLSLKPVSTDTNELLVLLTFSNWSAESKLVEFLACSCHHSSQLCLVYQACLERMTLLSWMSLLRSAKIKIQLSVPAYARAPEFSFELSCVTRSGKQLTVSPWEDFDLTSLTDQSTIDGTM